MGLLLGISKDDVENFTVAKPTGPGTYTDDTFVAVLGGDVWDCHIDGKRMLLWQLQKTHAKVHVVIKKHPTPFFGALQLSTNDPLFSPTSGDFLSLNSSGIAFGSRNGDPFHPWGPITTGITTAVINAAKAAIAADTTIRDDLIDYERLFVNFKSVLCEVTRNKADIGFNAHDYRAQGVSATVYHQSLYLFEDATGCSGVYHGTGHDFRPGRNPYALGNMFSVRVQTSDAAVPLPFDYPGLVSRHRTTGTGGFITYTFSDDVGNTVTAKISYSNDYDVVLDTFAEEFT